MRRRHTRVYLALAWHEPSHLNGINRYAGEKSWVLDRQQEHGMHDLQHFHPHGIICQLFRGVTTLVESVKEAQVPTVELGSSIPEMKVPRVLPDSEATGSLAAAHLISRGFTRFVFIGSTTQTAHHQGFDRAVRAAGFDSLVVTTTDPELQREIGENSPVSGIVHDTFSAARQAWARRLFSHCEKPVGVFVHMPVWAADIIEGCRKAHILVPDQVGVVSMAESPDIGASWPVPLTVLAEDYEEQGYQAAALLDRMMQGEKVPLDRVIKVPPRPLVPRASTFCYATDDLHIARAATFIMRNLHHPGLCVKQVCKVARIPRRSLYHDFPRHFTMPVGRYIEHLRIKEATRLLVSTDALPSAIAAQCGFGELLRFRRAFARAKNGTTPTAYRKQLAGHTVRVASAPATQHRGRLGRQEAPPACKPTSLPESQPVSIEMRVLRLLCKNPLGKKPLSLRLGQKEVSGQLNKIIRVLRADRAIEYTIPAKPNSRLQQYRLTKKGRLKFICHN